MVPPDARRRQVIQKDAEATRDPLRGGFSIAAFSARIKRTYRTRRRDLRPPPPLPLPPPPPPPPPPAATAAATATATVREGFPGRRSAGGHELCRRARSKRHRWMRARSRHDMTSCVRIAARRNIGALARWRVKVQ